MSKGGVRSSLELLPWLVPISDGLVICKDGAMLACYEITGLDLDSATSGQHLELAAAADRFAEVFRDQPVSFWWTVHRQKTEEYPQGQFPSMIAKWMDDEHRESFLAEGGYRNRHFVSVLWMPAKAAVGVLDRASLFIEEGLSPFRAAIEAIKASIVNRSSFAFRAAEISQAVREFEPLLERAEAAIYLNSPRRLRDEELLGFLWCCANPGQRMTPKAWDGKSLLDGYLPEQPITVYAEALGFGDGESRRYAAAISLKTPPTEGTQFSAFSGLLTMDCELTLSLVFRVASTKETEAHIATLKRINEAMLYPPTAYIAGAVRGGDMNPSKMDQGRAEALAEIAQAKGEMAAGRVVFGWANATLVLYHSSGEDLSDRVRIALRGFHTGKFVGAVRETIHLTSAWASTLPGQWQECQRWMMLSSANMVDLAPLVGVRDGEIENEHLSRQMGSPQPCLTVLNTDYRTPFYFNFHSGGVGHTLVFGPSGSGKSVAMNFLISQFGRYAGSRVMIFDKDYSCRIPTLLQGGVHVDLKPGARIRLNPLALCAEPRHRAFLVSWVESLISSRGYRITTADSQKISAALGDMAARFDPSLIRLSGLATQLDGHLRDELAPWLKERPDGGPEGSYADYFDHAEDELDLSRHLTAIEMNDVMRIPVVGRAFLDYAFYRLRLLLEGAGDGRVFPTLIYIEEAWFLMQDEAFCDRLIDWLKTFRKLNASVVMATQSLEDVSGLSPRILAALRDNVLTRLYLPNGSALSEGVYDTYHRGMGLSADQIERIAHAVPREDYFVVKPGIARMVKLRLTPLQIAACRSDQRAQRTFERHYQPDRPLDDWAEAYITDMLEEAP